MNSVVGGLDMRFTEASLPTPKITKFVVPTDVQCR